MGNDYRFWFSAKCLPHAPEPLRLPLSRPLSTRSRTPPATTTPTTTTTTPTTTSRSARPVAADAAAPAAPAAAAAAAWWPARHGSLDGTWRCSPFFPSSWNDASWYDDAWIQLCFVLFSCHGYQTQSVRRAHRVIRPSFRRTRSRPQRTTSQEAVSKPPP